MTFNEWDAMFFEDDICINCEGLALIRYNYSYRGYIAECKDCDSQWRVS